MSGDIRPPNPMNERNLTGSLPPPLGTHGGRKVGGPHGDHQELAHPLVEARSEECLGSNLGTLSSKTSLDLEKNAYSGSENTFEGKIALLIFDWKNNG